MVFALGIALVLQAEPTPFSLEHWNETRIQQNKTGMLFLGGWAGVSIIGGGLGAAFSKEPQSQSFYLGHAIFGGVNLGFALVAFFVSNGTNPMAFDAKQSLAEAETNAKIFLFNAGLDVAYVAGGGLLWQRGEALSDVRLTGMGQAFLIQGIGLAIFDTVMFFVANSHTGKLLENVTISPTGISGKF
jgi:hypothetical protein